MRGISRVGNKVHAKRQYVMLKPVSQLRQLRRQVALKEFQVRFGVLPDMLTHSPRRKPTQR